MTWMQEFETSKLVIKLPHVYFFLNLNKLSLHSIRFVQFSQNFSGEYLIPVEKFGYSEIHRNFVSLIKCFSGGFTDTNFWKKFSKLSRSSVLKQLDSHPFQIILIFRRMINQRTV